jgi:hypothetical protein
MTREAFCRDHCVPISYEASKLWVAVASEKLDAVSSHSCWRNYSVVVTFPMKVTLLPKALNFSKAMESTDQAGKGSPDGSTNQPLSVPPYCGLWLEFKSFRHRECLRDIVPRRL